MATKSKSKHIVIDARFLFNDAATPETYTQQLIRNVTALDRVNRYTILLNQVDAAEFDITAPNVRGLVINIPYYSLAEQTKLPKILKNLKPDLVHFTHFNHPLRFVGKFVVTLHDLTVVYYPVGRQQRNPLRRWAFLATMRHAAHHANKIIAVSHTTRDDIVKDLGGDPATIEVIPEGLSFVSKAKSGNEDLTTYGIRSPYLLYVSQWRPHKRIEDLVAAFERIAKEYPKLQLVLAGKPNAAFPAIIDRVEHSPMRHRIITPGFVPDELMSALYQGAELFVFPSLYEGFGFPPLEAMAMGTPVIAADASCLPEILGDAAKYFEAGNVTSLADAMTELLDDESARQELSKLGKVQAAKYDWKTVAQETHAVYESLL